MHNIIFPSKDSTIYSKYPDINTGLDEILEINKEITSSLSSSIDNSRILLKFDLSNLNSASYESASVVYLNLYTCISRRIPIEYTLVANPITQYWEMGTGNFTDKKTKTGVSWNKRTTVDNWILPGGDYNASIIASQSFNYEPTDVRMNITNIFNYWKSNQNHGIIVKRPDIDETSSVNYGHLSFYSMNTHTVYLPTLEVLYDDHIYNTSSLDSGSKISGSINIHLKNVMPTYKYNETVRFEFLIKKSYEPKTFYETLVLDKIYYLDDNTLFYSIKDAYTNRVIIPFSEYTKVSLNSNGYFFDVILSGFMPEKFYKIDFKYIDSGAVRYIETTNQFKVIK